MKKKPIRFEAGDLLIHTWPERWKENRQVIYVLLDRFSIPVGSENVPRHFWHLFDTTRQKRVSLYEKKMRHEVRKNPDQWKLVKKK